MPRRDAWDGGDDGIMGPPGRYNQDYTMTHMSQFQDSVASGSISGANQNEDLELLELERQLNEEVDEEFFEEPRKFNTLHRVIDVLGLQMIDDATVQTSMQDLERNPAYQNLKRQQNLVEGAIEHMAVIHCADLNGSVIQVGRVARQFSEAVAAVRNLRKQVRDIQDTLGASAAAASANPNEPGSNSNNNALTQQQQQASNNASRPAANAAAMSLRELWLKKLECEAVLSLLEKLDIIRAAPARFDQYVSGMHQNNVRIGAAVLTVSQALDTMFLDDVSQVQALHKIMEQLMLRKQRAEEIIWDTIQDVLFLRTGNGFLIPRLSAENAAPAAGGSAAVGASGAASGNSVAGNSSNHNIANSKLLQQQQQLAASNASSNSVSSDSRRASNFTSRYKSYSATAAAQVQQQQQMQTQAAADALLSHGMINPFAGRHVRFALDYADWQADNMNSGSGGNNNQDDADNDSVASGASLFSLEDADGAGGADENDNKDANNNKSNINNKNNATSAAGGGADANNLATTHRMLIPLSVLEAELDLEADERRCLEELALQGMARAGGKGTRAMIGTASARNRGLRQQQQQNHHLHYRSRILPRYADPVLALRILVECLAKLNRLDDVERNVSEHLAFEIRAILQKEQARTFARLEQKQRRFSLLQPSVRKPAQQQQQQQSESLQEFRRHLTALLSAFGCVLIRITHLAQILRIRISNDRALLQKIESPSTILRPVLQAAYDLMQKEIKEFLKACLLPTEDAADPVESAVNKGSTAGIESGLFSLGILNHDNKDGDGKVSQATRSNVMEMSIGKFVTTVLFPKTKSEPAVRHALTFRRSIARWTTELDNLKKELALCTGEDTSLPSYNVQSEERAIEFLDKVIQRDLLPVLQKEADNGTIKGLERSDAFDPILDRSLYTRPNTNEPQDVDMCSACQALYDSTGPLFQALHRLPRGGEMYLPLVAVLEHNLLTFISRLKQQVSKICSQKTALAIVMMERESSSFAAVTERRAPFSLLLHAYADGDAFETSPSAEDLTKQSSMVMPLSPPSGDTTPRQTVDEFKSDTHLEDAADGVEGEEMILQQELNFLEQYLDFASDSIIASIVVCSDEELVKAASLAHSLMKLSSLLESRLKIRGSSGFNRTLTSTRALREAIKTIKLNGIKLCKFCRMDMLMQSIIRMAKVCRSSTLVARDAVRIPSSVNDLGEYLTGAAENLREAAGNAVTAYIFSSLEQYIPLCLMQTVRVVAAGKGIVTKAPLTMNGIEALDRSGSVLYRDLKGATSFDNSFWDVELAAVSFERSASFIAMMELEMEELVAYYSANRGDFSDEDFELMFSMTGPRRRGDVSRFHMLKRRMK